ncbi:polyprenyl synthetase family protein [Streptomyces phyllanthi]|uniref:Polyprenyl synthetase family protein n=1 Tax=Streptomyces phyllanthi TaxID=1803180 RepID=A0A5N8VTS8_9ACTN|nr:polyprenyl synthetase family protein [Streptomyces phyllanthi]MPY38651.1 polyprenyl synthetase family protein [Streptomyces phyllanthi]
MHPTGTHPTGAGEPAPAMPCGGAGHDIAEAVRHELRGYLGERLAQAAMDDTFAREVAERVVRFTLGGGRRLRPALLWWSWRACAGPERGAGAEAALRIAAALELIQSCALAHDDVMDGSALRRGAASIHADFAQRHTEAGLRGSAAAYGRAVAVLAGDLALVWADDLLADTALAESTRRAVHAQWRAMRTEMIGGQCLDLHAQASASESPAEALRIACLKSALYSVARPMALGAALAGADERTTGALCSAGRRAGIAFQLRDDLLGVFGDPGQTGKPAGDDLREGKLTYLVAVARVRARAAGDQDALGILASHLGDPGLGPRDLGRLRDVLTRTGARDAVEAEIHRLVRHGMRSLDSAVPESAARRELGRLLALAAGTDVPAHDRAPSPGPCGPHARVAAASEGVCR